MHRRGGGRRPPPHRGDHPPRRRRCARGGALDHCLAAAVAQHRLHGRARPPWPRLVHGAGQHGVSADAQPVGGGAQLSARGRGVAPRPIRDAALHEEQPRARRLCAVVPRAGQTALQCGRARAVCVLVELLGEWLPPVPASGGPAGVRLGPEKGGVVVARDHPHVYSGWQLHPRFRLVWRGRRELWAPPLLRLLVLLLCHHSWRPADAVVDAPLRARHGPQRPQTPRRPLAAKKPVPVGRRPARRVRQGDARVQAAARHVYEAV